MRKIALPKRTVLLPGAAILVIALAVAGILALQGRRGKGTREDPYLISGKADLQRLGRDVKNDIRYEGQYFELTQDIDLNGEAWTPIGFYFSPFMGVFDGAGHTISGMTAADEYNCGLFMSLQDAQIFDLTVTGSIRSSGEQGHTGGIAGSSSKSRIINCHFICEQDGSAGGANRSFVGGIVGFSSESSLEGCTAAGSFVGCVAGYNGGLIAASGASGAVQTASEACAGGIVGFDSTTNEAPDIGTRNCAAECDISAGEGSEAHRVAGKAGILSNNTANADTRINGAVIDPADEKYGADRLHGATLQS